MATPFPPVFLTSFPHPTNPCVNYVWIVVLLMLLIPVEACALLDFAHTRRGEVASAVSAGGRYNCQSPEVTKRSAQRARPNAKWRIFFIKLEKEFVMFWKKAERAVGRKVINACGLLRRRAVEEARNGGHGRLPDYLAANARKGKRR